MTYTPEQFTKSGTEQGHQTALFLYFQQNRAQYPETRLLFAVPNGGARHKAEAARMVAAGVKAGVPDICLPVPRGGLCGLWIELKRPRTPAAVLKAVQTPLKRAGKASAAQLDWIAELQGQGYRALVCYGYDEARTAIEQYLALNTRGVPLDKTLFPKDFFGEQQNSA